MASSASVCPGLSSNPDISGPGVRIALYLQSLLSVLLVRLSPKDAPAAYWSMTSTALALIISSIVTSLLNQISLLDAIVVVYVLLLPILASAFGLSEILSAPSSKSSTRRVYSPLLIIANWTRSALTYSFALYVWATAPTFGSGTLECNEATRLIFFGASLPALGSGRYLNLVGWGLLTLLFVWRTLRGSATIWIALRALVSSSARNEILKPKMPAENEIHLEGVDRLNYRTGAFSHSERAYRPRQIFHEVLKGVANQILGWAPSGKNYWYRKYGQVILICGLSIWAIVMTELELTRLDKGENNQWGFGQVLPMVLTISPLLSLFESLLSERSPGRIRHGRTLRMTMRSASNLQRPRCELDNLPPSMLSAYKEEDIQRLRSPSPFVVVTVDDRDMFVTYDQQDAKDPEWQESFDIQVNDTSTAVLRVFDLKCMDRNWPSLIGYTTIHPFSLLPPAEKGENPQGQLVQDANDAETIEYGTFPLFLDGKKIPNTNIIVSLGTDIHGPLPLPRLPVRFRGLKETRVEKKVNLVSFRGKRVGSNKTTTTETYWLG